MVLKLFFDISTSFRFSKDQCECTLHSEAPPCITLLLIQDYKLDPVRISFGTLIMVSALHHVLTLPLFSELVRFNSNSVMDQVNIDMELCTDIWLTF